jgi:hypothetical protein
MKRLKDEWSEWDERYRRQSPEGKGRLRRVVKEFQL